MFYPSGRQRCGLSSSYKSSTRQITRQEPSMTRQVAYRKSWKPCAKTSPESRVVAQRKLRCSLVPAPRQTECYFGFAAGFGIVNSATCCRFVPSEADSEKRKTSVFVSSGIFEYSGQLLMRARKSLPSPLEDVAPWRTLHILPPRSSKTSICGEAVRLAGVACLQTVTMTKFVQPAGGPTPPQPCHKPRRADHDGSRCLSKNDCHGLGGGS